MSSQLQALDLYNGIVSDKGENQERVQTFFTLLSGDSFPLIEKGKFDELYTKLTSDENESNEIMGNSEKYPESIVAITLVRKLLRNNDLNTRQLVDTSAFKSFVDKYGALLF